MIQMTYEFRDGRATLQADGTWLVEVERKDAKASLRLSGVSSAFVTSILDGPEALKNVEATLETVATNLSLLMCMQEAALTWSSTSPETGAALQQRLNSGITGTHQAMHAINQEACSQAEFRRLMGGLGRQTEDNNGERP
jgi:hypothetical protein